MSDPVWQRLGEALQRRRVEIDPRYRNLALFARERSLNERLVADIEHGRRKGYRPGTRHALEISYELDAGRIQRFVAGEVTDLGPRSPVAPQDAGAQPPLRYDDPRIQYVADTPGVSYETARALAELTRILLERDEAPGQSRSA